MRNHDKRLRELEKRHPVDIPVLPDYILDVLTALDRPDEITCEDVLNNPAHWTQDDIDRAKRGIAPLSDTILDRIAHEKP